MKNRILIVAICLIPLLAIVLFILLGNDCLNESDAQPIYEKALELERDKNYKEAYHQFKHIDAYACSNYTLRSMSFNKAVEIKNLYL